MFTQCFVLLLDCVLDSIFFNFAAMSLPKSDVIQTFLQEKLRREKSEKVPLLWEDNTPK